MRQTHEQTAAVSLDEVETIPVSRKRPRNEATARKHDEACAHQQARAKLVKRAHQRLRQEQEKRQREWTQLWQQQWQTQPTTPDQVWKFLHDARRHACLQRILARVTALDYWQFLSRLSLKFEQPRRATGLSTLGDAPDAALRLLIPIPFIGDVAACTDFVTWFCQELFAPIEPTPS